MPFLAANPLDNHEVFYATERTLFDAVSYYLLGQLGSYARQPGKILTEARLISMTAGAVGEAAFCGDGGASRQGQRGAAIANHKKVAKILFIASPPDICLCSRESQHRLKQRLINRHKLRG